MKNSDLFLELFDDELLKPKVASEDAVLQVIDGTAPLIDVSTSDSQKKSVRTEFDLCSALEKDADVEVIKSEAITETRNYPRNESVIHSGDTDSSDDEDNKYMDSYNFNEFGRDVKRMLQAREAEKLTSVLKTNGNNSVKEYGLSNSFSNVQETSSKRLALPPKTQSKPIDLYSDPFFGIRIVNPLISSKGIELRMNGKSAVTLHKLQAHLAKNVDTDFVTAGVIVRSITKQSQNDTKYMIWELSDLRDDLVSVSVFLFGRSYKDLWKTQIGTVVAVLNPQGNSNNKAGSHDSFSITVKFSDQVMVWGTSKDYGTCKSIKKNGEKCTSFINKSRCEYCIYHVKKEYSKFSSYRSEIQSPIGNSKDINFLRNKVLGKNEVFYGGKSYSSLKQPQTSEKAKKMISTKDKQRLTQLGCTVFEKKREASVRTVSLPRAPRALMALRTVDTDSRILKSLSSPATNRCNNSPDTESCSSDSRSSIKSKSIESNGNGRVSIGVEAKPSKLSDSNRKTAPSTADTPDVSVKANDGKLKCKFNSLFDSLAASKRPSEGNRCSSEKPRPNGRGEDPTKNSQTLRHDFHPNRNTDVKPCLSNPENDGFEIKNSGNGDGTDETSSSSSKTKPNHLTDKCRSRCDDEKPAPHLDSTRKSSRNDDNLQNRFNNLFKLDSRGKTTDSIVNEKTAAVLEESASGRLEMLNTSGSIPPATRPASSNISKAKARALQFVKHNGPILKTDADAVKRSTGKQSRKRTREDVAELDGTDVAKGRVVFSQLYMDLMKKTSSQQDLVELERLRMEEEYFEKMGLKEQLEEKMLNTFKIDCKAVKCIECKYIWFSAADTCKAQRHTLKIVDSVKRFFKCGRCGNRTVSLHIVPMLSCNNCQSSSWQRAPMMKERVCKGNNELSIRGGEQQFINSQITNSSLNLLVPH